MHEELRILDAARRVLEHADEELTDDLALAFGIGHAGERIEEAVGGPHMHELDLLIAPERLDDLLALALAHESRIDEDTRELGADGLVDERRGDSRVDTTRQPTDRPAGADLRAHEVDLGIDDRAHRPTRFAARRVVEEVLEDLLAVRGVHHLGMELHAVDGARSVLERGHRRLGGSRRDRKPGRGIDDRVEVAHPHLLLVGHPAPEQRSGRPHRQRRAAVLAATRAVDATAKLLGDELCAVANAEDRHAEVVHRAVDRWSTLGVHRLGAAREDDRRGLLGHDLVDGDRVRHDLAVDVGLAHSTSDELRVLRAEVDDEHGVNALRHQWADIQWPMPTPWERCSDLPSVCNAGATMTSAFWKSLTSM
ncbi:unannotated protein [freshwater metagenome]|uniref:Unannotated protein n=1 Tax=freshwater metagenome TaxID=449393 RepID=A0A6J7APH3_9ZZZZ